MIIPVFVPHEGCPNDCAFCNQRTISGKSCAPTERETEEIIEKHLETNGNKAEQIAFFGGSFTGIDTDTQNMYLSVAYKYVKSGKVGSIRLSTRPDYITRDTVKRLESYGVKNIELGAQSMDEEVLKLSNRGHTAFHVENASEIITSSGVTLGLQMMTGLPADNEEKCLYTARRFKELGAKETRIYPTVVLRGTLLEKMYINKEYTPQTVEEAVNICGKLYRFFRENDIEILRIGLPESSDLKDNFVGGAYHPAIGEMIISRDIRNRIEEESGDCKEIVVVANPAFISKIKGNRKCNEAYFREKGRELIIIPDINTEEYVIKR